MKVCDLRLWLTTCICKECWQNNSLEFGREMSAPSNARDFENWLSLRKVITDFAQFVKISELRVLVVLKHFKRKKVKNFPTIIAKNSRIRMIPNLSKSGSWGRFYMYSNFKKWPLTKVPVPKNGGTGTLVKLIGVYIICQPNLLISYVHLFVFFPTRI